MFFPEYFTDTEQADTLFCGKLGTQKENKYTAVVDQVSVLFRTEPRGPQNAHCKLRIMSTCRLKRFYDLINLRKYLWNFSITVMKMSNLFSLHFQLSLSLYQRPLYRLSKYDLKIIFGHSHTGLLSILPFKTG